MAIPELHDIKPPVEVPDHSLMLLILVSLLAFGTLAGLLYWGWSILRADKGEDPRRHHFNALRGVDLEDAKTAAYAITEHGRPFKEDSERLLNAYEALVERLEPFKYRPRVAPIDEETRAHYRLFVEMIDV